MLQRNFMKYAKLHRLNINLILITVKDIHNQASFTIRNAGSVSKSFINNVIPNNKRTIYA